MRAEDLPGEQTWHELTVWAPVFWLYVEGLQGKSMSLMVFLQIMSRSSSLKPASQPEVFSRQAKLYMM